MGLIEIKLLYPCLPIDNLDLVTIPERLQRLSFNF